MNQFFEKVKESIIADFNEVTSSVQSERKHNPIAQLNKYIRECEREVEKAEKLVARQKLLKAEFYNEWKNAETLADKRKQQRELAISAGENELANVAMQYEAWAKEQSARLKLAYETSLNQLSTLEQKYEEMQRKVKDMHIKRLELMGRENVLSMKEKMNKLLDETEFGHAAQNLDNIDSFMSQKETDANDDYEMTVFDAKIQQLAKELNNQEKQKTLDENVVQ